MMLIRRIELMSGKLVVQLPLLILAQCSKRICAKKTKEIEKEVFKMVKKFLCTVLVVLALFAFTMYTPLLSQEEGEDIEDFSLEELLNVEITTAGKQAEKISEIPASVVLVTREDIDKFGYQSLTEILENIPGLYQTNDYFTENFGVRGFWSVRANRNMVILVNDIPQFENITSGHWMREITIPVEAIDRIEVVRGPMSVIYGTGAFFGVINIKTDQVDEKKPINIISVSYGSENTAKLALRASGKSGDFVYAFTGSYLDTDGIDAPFEDMGVAGNRTTEKLLDRSNKYINFSGAFKGFSFDVSYAEDQADIMFLAPSTNGAPSVYRSTRLTFGYEKNFTEKLKVSGRLNYTFGDYDYVYDFGIFGVENDGTKSYKVELNLFWDPSSRLNLQMGVDYYKILEQSVTYSLPGWGLSDIDAHLADGESIISQAFFTQLSYRLSDRLKIVAGIRLDQMPKYTIEQFSSGGYVGNILSGTYDKTDIEIIPRLALIYSLNDKNYFKLLYGKAIKRPAFGEIMDMLSNPTMPSLQPEDIQTIELNYIGSLSSKFSLSLSLFRNTLDQLIYRTLFIQQGTLVMYQANTGKMSTNGVELTLTTIPFKDFFLELSGTYQDTEDERDGMEDIEVGYSPKFLGYIKGSYFFNNDISIALTANYVDKMYAYYDATIPGRLGNGDPVDSYFLLGANLRIRNLFGTGLYLNMRASNLLDEKVHYPTTSNNTWAAKGTMGMGMSFLFTLGMIF